MLGDVVVGLGQANGKNPDYAERLRAQLDSVQPGLDELQDELSDAEMGGEPPDEERDEEREEKDEGDSE